MGLLRFGGPLLFSDNESGFARPNHVFHMNKSADGA